MTKPSSIPIVAKLIAARELTVEQLIADTLQRIDAVNPSINAFITLDRERALADARRLDAELARGNLVGPLHGMPVSVKDLVDVAGLPTTAGSRVRRGHVATEDAPIVVRLRSAGAIIIGKTNLHEFAYGTTSEDSAYGPVRNPLDTSRSPGGSSGGSAAAIAAGLCAGSVGTDTGGSIRIPAAACGVVGLKPTYDELPCEGIVPLSRTLDHVGPMAADVESTWLLYRTMAGVDTGDNPARAGFRANGAGFPQDEPNGQAVRTLRIGVPRGYFLDMLDDDVRAQFEATLDRLARDGAHVSTVQVPHSSTIATVYMHIQLPESSAYHAATLEREPDAYTPPVRIRLEMGRYVLAEDYARARRGQEVLRAEVDEALNDLDVLALPTLPLPAPRLGQGTARLGTNELPVRAAMLRLTQLFDITGHPAISMPCGLSADRMPIGLQLVGRRNATEDLLRVALACERQLAR